VPQQPLYLTFDDGPSPEITGRVLAELAARRAHATFFQEGRRVEQLPEVTRAVRDGGHLVGNHTWRHPNLTQLDDAELEEELRRTSEVIEDACGVRPRVFRPPYGEMGDSLDAKRRVVRHAARLGMKTVRWHVASRDYQHVGVQGIVQNVVTQARPHAVVLLHDVLPDTAEAVGPILDQLGASGFSFELLPDEDVINFEPSRWRRSGQLLASHVRLGR
jgi:peptidoglycan/xylan/chitin deacetylase (PgdA/CDA1 family)